MPRTLHIDSSALTRLHKLFSNQCGEYQSRCPVLFGICSEFARTSRVEVVCFDKIEQIMFVFHLFECGLKERSTEIKYMQCSPPLHSRLVPFLNLATRNWPQYLKTALTQPLILLWHIYQGIILQLSPPPPQSQWKLLLDHRVGVSQVFGVRVIDGIQYSFFNQYKRNLTFAYVHTEEVARKKGLH